MRLIGKAPSRRDFIPMSGRSDGNDPRFSALLDGCVERLKPKDWGALDRLGVCAFALTGPSGQACIGVIGASQDEVGRRFPLMVYEPVTLAETGVAGPLVVLAAGGWLEVAASLCDSLRRGGAADVLSDGSLTSALVASSASAHQQWFDWARTAGAAEVSAALMPMADVDALLYVFDFVYAAAGAERGAVSGNNPLVLKLPVGNAGPAAVTFWSQVLTSIVRPGGRLLPWLWSPSESSAWFWLGDWSHTTLRIVASGVSDDLCDLSAPDGKLRATLGEHVDARVESAVRTHQPLETILAALEGMQ